VRYFITGATGFIGGRVARQLAAAGHEVRALVRSRARAGGHLLPRITACEGDITDRASMRPHMAGADGVFHIAGWFKVGVRDTRDGERINVDGTRNVLSLMKDLHIPKGVYTSTIAVFSDTGGRIVDETYRHEGPWLSEYDRTKWVAHYQVAEPMIADGLPLVIVQPGATYGPGDASTYRDSFVQYLRRRLPMLPLRAAYCWAHVDDTARGHVLAMERGRAGESYIIGGPPHTLIEVFALAERITMIPAPRIHMAPGLLRAAAGLMGVVEHVVAVPEDLRAERLRVLAGVTYLGSSAKAERELGFSVRPLQEGLRETLLHEMTVLGMRPSVGAP
jgi:nucleoside-diphosphate-sugar epimerase